MVAEIMQQLHEENEDLKKQNRKLLKVAKFYKKENVELLILLRTKLDKIQEKRIYERKR
mgnify:FL=1